MRARIALAGLILAAACDGPGATDADRAQSSVDFELRQAMSRSGVAQIAAPAAQPAAMVDLGRALFFDKILSGNRDISCASCHDLTLSAIDGLPLAVGTGGSGAGAERVPGVGRPFVPRNAPTMLNTSLGFFYMLWDGRVGGFGSITQGPKGVVFPSGLASVLAAQAMLPVLSRVEMRGRPGDADVFGNPNELATASDSVAGVWKAIMQRLLTIQEYANRFAQAYPGVPQASLGFQHAANAIAAYETATFTRHNSPLDRYLGRDNAALGEDAKLGALVFFGKGQCSQCHGGPQLGGGRFANVGVPQLGPGIGAELPLDLGRAEVEPFGGFNPQQNPYRFSFRAPPLRNVELTAPYMHNGAYPTLEAVVRHYTNPDSALRNYDVMQLPPALRASHHGDAVTIASVRATLDREVRDGIRLTAVEQGQVIAFLKSLTDPSARNLGSLIPASVPSGLPIR